MTPVCWTPLGWGSGHTVTPTVGGGLQTASSTLQRVPAQLLPLKSQFLPHPVTPVTSLAPVVVIPPPTAQLPLALAGPFLPTASAGCATSPLREVPGELQALGLGPAQPSRAAGAGEQAQAWSTAGLCLSPPALVRKHRATQLPPAGNVPVARLELLELGDSMGSLPRRGAGPSTASYCVVPAGPAPTELASAWSKPGPGAAIAGTGKGGSSSWASALPALVPRSQHPQSGRLCPALRCPRGWFAQQQMWARGWAVRGQ